MKKFREFPLDHIAAGQLKQLAETLIPVPEKTVSQRAEALLKKTLGLNKKLKAKQESVSMKLHYESIWSTKSLHEEFSVGEPLPKTSESRRVIYDGKYFYSPDRWLTAAQIICLASQIRRTSPRAVIEIGSGSGMLMIALAAIFPRQQFVGLELTEAGIKSATNAMVDRSVVTHICTYVFGQDILPDIVFPISNLSFEQVDMAKSVPELTADLAFTSLAFEQMEDVFDDAFTNSLRLFTNEALFFEPFLEFNSRKQREVLRAKKYLYRSLPSKELEGQGMVELLSMPHKINKAKFSFGVVRIERP